MVIQVDDKEIAGPVNRYTSGSAQLCAGGRAVVAAKALYAISRDGGDIAQPACNLGEAEAQRHRDSGRKRPAPIFFHHTASNFLRCRVSCYFSVFI